MRCIGKFLAASLVLASPMAMGAVSDEAFEQLRAELAALAERVEQLAAENAELRRAGTETEATVANVQPVVGDQETAVDEQSSWMDRIRFDGDFRYRYENIDEEGQEDRNRSRIRARANLRADLPRNVEVGFGLATGGEDPVSANQTLGSGGSSKRINLNLAYADWNATEGLHVMGGKFKNPLQRVGKQALMWDGDWTPEGLAVTYKRDIVYLNTLGTWLESDSKDGNSNFSWGAQLGGEGKVGDVKLKGGVGYFDIKTKGDRTYFGDPNNPADYFGNTSVGTDCGMLMSPTTNCVYAFDYLLTEVFGEVGFGYGGFPTVLFFDYVNNSDPSDNNTAWTAGFRAGQTTDSGQVQFSYFYADKEADGVFGLLTDSDFAGGGTDNKGHFTKLMYGINRSWSIGAQYFINEIDINSGSKRDYNRLMIDTQWKYK
jgi:hypothetical protein